MKTGKTSGSRRAIQVVLASGIVAGAAMPATADDIFLNIPGVPGESTDSKHKGEIEVISYTQVADGKACLITINKGIDRASPILAAAATGRSTFASARISLTKTGGDRFDYLFVDLQSVSVQGYAQNATTNVASREEVALVPRTITITYRPRGQDGSPMADVVSTLNCPK